MFVFCYLTAGELRTRERAEASHERLVDPPGGIPGAGGVVGKAEIPGGWLTAKWPQLFCLIVCLFVDFGIRE